MKTKNVKKMLAFTLSTTMIMGMSMTVLASDPVSPPPAGSVEAPIYSYDLVNVIVPTTYAVAFNPDELAVKVGSDNPTDQILSKSYGIVNKSTKDKIVTVELQIEDLNTGENQVTFVDSAADATGAEAGEFAIYLAATPADATEVKIGSASADKDTETGDVADVTMAKATGKDVALYAGSNNIAFKLDKATYSLKSGSNLELGTTDKNNVGDLYEVTALAGAGKGITGFTFTGAMNKNADWTKLQNGIKVTAIYTSKNADSSKASTTEQIITGTGAMVQADSTPKFSCSTVGEITYTEGFGELAFKAFKTISAPWEGTPLDLTSFATVDTSTSKITVDPSVFSGWAANGENPTATITYENQAGEEKTATVVLKTF